MPMFFRVANSIRLMHHGPASIRRSNIERDAEAAAPPTCSCPFGGWGWRREKRDTSVALGKAVSHRITPIRKNPVPFATRARNFSDRTLCPSTHSTHPSTHPRATGRAAHERRSKPAGDAHEACMPAVSSVSLILRFCGEMQGECSAPAILHESVSNSRPSQRPAHHGGLLRASSDDNTAQQQHHESLGRQHRHCTCRARNPRARPARARASLLGAAPVPRRRCFQDPLRPFPGRGDFPEGQDHGLCGAAAKAKQGLGLDPSHSLAAAKCCLVHAATTGSRIPPARRTRRVRMSRLNQPALRTPYSGSRDWPACCC